MEAFIVLIIFSSMVGLILGWRYMSHRERLAELEVKKLQALGEAAKAKMLPADRADLAEELLAAYDEANRGLTTDEPRKT